MNVSNGLSKVLSPTLNVWRRADRYPRRRSLTRSDAVGKITHIKYCTHGFRNNACPDSYSMKTCHELQPKLLDVVQRGTVRPLGSDSGPERPGDLCDLMLLFTARRRVTRRTLVIPVEKLKLIETKVP